MSRETTSKRPGLFAGIKRMIKSVLRFFLRPFKPYIVHVVRICLREEMIQLETLRKALRDYDARSQKMSKTAADQESRIKTMRERILRQNEEIERLEESCREEKELRLRETKRLKKLRAILEQVREQHATGSDDKTPAVRLADQYEKNAA